MRIRYQVTPYPAFLPNYHDNFIAIDPNVPRLLLTLTGRGIIPPQDRSPWPAQECLYLHRREWKL